MKMHNKHNFNNMCRNSIVDSLECRVLDISYWWQQASSWVVYDELRDERDRLGQTGEYPERYSTLDEILYEYSTVNSDLCAHLETISRLRGMCDASEQCFGDFKKVTDELVSALAENLEIVDKWKSKYLK